MSAQRPVLSIAIPTWNRAAFLAETLAQLRSESAGVAADRVEIIVSDNCSSDNTQQVVEKARSDGLTVRYVRNERNIGSDANIAQCFNIARGRYVLILGDDDLLVDGALGLLLEYLDAREYSVVCVRPYGFDRDFRKEHPGGHGRVRECQSAREFLAAVGPLITLISCCLINKSLLQDVDAREFCGGNLVQVHLVLRALLSGAPALYLQRYLLAYKRNNSGGYEFSQVFVKELGDVLDRYRSMGLSDDTIQTLETKMLIAYYPFYVFRQRLGGQGDAATEYARFKARFGGRWPFRLLVAPILQLPRPLGLFWGAVVTLVGRVATGDLRRGVMFAWRRLVS